MDPYDAPKEEEGTSDQRVPEDTSSLSHARHEPESTRCKGAAQIIRVVPLGDGSLRGTFSL